ncbi:MAG: peptide MFS transporter [Bacteroidales bacterium]|jgi:POT family proton-dependent oligopeptide transporter|nr:peptide MFS transporter [Bacteroidales bacterium]
MFKNHPKGLILASLSNMGERFGYYIMNAILVLFLAAKFGLDESTTSIIYSIFYASIYVLSLAGGLIADKKANYKGTIISGLVIMSIGYILLAVPTPTPVPTLWLFLGYTCLALLFIAFGNGLFKGNLQAIVGQMYDTPQYNKYRDAGFQIFYVFINIGGLFAPFVAPALRSWWLHKNLFEYNAALPELCHKFIGGTIDPQQTANLQELAGQVTMAGNATDFANLTEFCNNYLSVFNTGFHYAFLASVVAMLVSLTIFGLSKKLFPNPFRKQATTDSNSTLSAEEKSAMAKEIRQRILGVFAVLGVVIFFWFSFHQNGVSLSFFARDFVNTKSIAPEVWQFINPFFVVFLTPIIMWIFGALQKKGKEPSTPAKIGIGMGIAALGYIFLTIVSSINGLPSGTEFKGLPIDTQEAMKLTWWVLVGMYFFMTVAELFISPLGLSFVSKVAPKNMQGLMQGLWLAATAAGNILLFIGGILYKNADLWKCWLVFAAVCLISMLVMLAMVRWLERITTIKE